MSEERVVRIKGNEIQLEGKDFADNDEVYKIMIRVIKDKRKELNDPDWAGEGRTEQQKEARDQAIKLYAFKVRATSSPLTSVSDRIMERLRA